MTGVVSLRPETILAVDWFYLPIAAKKIGDEARLPPDYPLSVKAGKGPFGVAPCPGTPYNSERFNGFGREKMMVGLPRIAATNN